MAEIKKTPKKMKGGDVRMVDNQILRRRKMLKEKGIILGKASARAEKINAADRAERAKPEAHKRKWFGSSE